MTIRTLCVALSVLAVAGCAQPEPLGPPIVVPAEAGLSAPALRDAIVGNTGTGMMSGSTVIYSMYVGPDGTALAKLPTGIDRGSWHITEDGQWCVRWQLYKGGREYCQRVYPEANAYRFVNTTSVEELAFAPGKRI